MYVKQVPNICIADRQKQVSCLLSLACHVSIAFDYQIDILVQSDQATAVQLSLSRCVSIVVILPTATDQKTTFQA